jgi:hypothetical protein
LEQRFIRDIFGGDMHRDSAAEILFLPKKEVPKPVRQAVKGGFVFAEFYGDWYMLCCQSL